MKFKNSPAIELTVRNTRLSINEDNTSMHVGTSVWPCSLVLVKFAERWHPPTCTVTPNPYASLLNFQNKRAIEIGAGCGAASMGLYLLGLEDITITDIAPVMPALKHNLKRNKHALGNRNLRIRTLCWKSEEQIEAVMPRYDVVVATDVVYIEEDVGVLVRVMERLVKEDGVVLLGYQVRSVEADTLFWEVCPNVFDVEKIPHCDLHLEYAFEESDVFVLRKKKTNVVVG